jgi:PilZ domain-containing protein
MSAKTLPNGSRLVEHLIQVTAAPLRFKDENMEAQAAVGRQTVARLNNRRRVPRVSVGASRVVVQMNGEDVSAVDLSLGGLQIRSATRFVPGAAVMTSIRWRGECLATIALTRVVWATIAKSHTLAIAEFRVGAAFESADFRAIRSILSRCGLDTSAVSTQ